MAPARMINFIDNHIHQCEICLADPELQEEIAKITDIILPESKLPKATRLQQEQDTDIDPEHTFENGEDDPEETTEDDNEEDSLEEIDLF